jgi:hypothetical protein
MKIDLRNLFGTDDSAEIARRFDAYKGALDETATKTARGDFTPDVFGGPAAQPQSDLAVLAKALGRPDVVKAVSADALSSFQSQIDVARAAMGDLNKDFTLTSPLSTGYVAYDLEAPAKMLTPRPTPLRNRIARDKGQGTARRYKRITGLSGTGNSGAPALRPGLTDTTQTNFANSGSSNALYFNRGQKIAYVGDEATVPYLQFGLSDQIPWSAQFSGQGFQDIRQLSQTSVLYASMLSEERLLLGGRGTASGFVGALATPTGTVTLTVRNAGTGETGNSANIATLNVTVTAATVFGETVLLASAANTGLSAATGKVIDVQVAGLNVPGAQAYNVYIGTAAGQSSQYAANCSISTGTAAATPQFGKQVSTLVVASGSAGAVTVNFTGAGTGGMPNSGSQPPATANDSSAQDYDGILSIVQDPARSGYVKNLGAAFSSNPGNEYQQAFSVMYDNVKADPDEILMNGNDRRVLSDLIKLNANSSAYRISLTNDNAHGATIGSVVTGIQNETTGKVVDLTVHPWLPQGVTPILSWTLPIPDTEVSDVWKSYNVQDYMAVNWPVNQFSYDVSTYWYGTFLCYAPAWNGCLTGIVRG